MSFEDLHRPLTAAGFRGAIRWIIISTGMIFILQHFIGPPMVNYFALTPVYVLQRFRVWQVATYMGLHGGVFHWLFNMLILWMFGRELEVRWGTAYFVRYCLICGVGAGLCVLLLSPHSTIPTLGASGAIFGLLVAFAMTFPQAVLYLYLVVPVRAWQAVLIFAFIEFFAGLEGGGTGLGRFAHLGGMLTGYLYLRSGDWIRIRGGQPFRQWFNKVRIVSSSSKSKPVVFHEVTDELVSEVDRILEKILREGVDSLSDKERQIMERYSKLKH